MRRAYVDLKRGQMHYRYAGQGEPLVMVHMSANYSIEFEDCGNILAASYSVYALDLFGYGFSDKTEKYLSVREHMETVLEFMDAMGISSAYFVGTLVGANVCARLAAAWPQRAQGLMLAGVCFNPDPNMYPGLRHAPVFHLVPPSDGGDHLKDMWMKASRYGETPAIRDVRALGMHLAGDCREGMHWALCEDTDFGDCLPLIKAPTFVTAYDPTPVGGPMPEEAAKRIPGAKFEVMSGCSPLVSIAAPEKFAAYVTKYFG
ncbi:MAG: alpha/beta hydrolase [Peptococcaceae bacterium]|nr:alpha/beta hydrolase [Peptococcaceae bacterium]